MQRFEYKVVPAPRRGEKAKGIKRTEDRFALALTQIMNELGQDGWDYVRSDTLPCEERSGLTSKTTTFQNMLVFRRALPATEEPHAQTAPAAARSAISALKAPAVTMPAPRVTEPLNPSAPVLGPALVHATKPGKPEVAAE